MVALYRYSAPKFYMPMIPELPIAMLACARLGATHSVIFGGFSAESIRDRVNDCEAKLVITADAGYRRGGLVPLKENVDAALDGAPSVEHVLVVRRVGEGVRQVAMQTDRDLWWHEVLAQHDA